MTLNVKNYTWTQTESTVNIRVPIKGARASNVDIVSTDEYLKVHFPPFLFEAFLFEMVDDSRSTAKIGNGVIVFTLQKRACRLWEHLMVQTNDKEAMKEIRERAQQQFLQKVCAESREKAEKQHADKKYALQTMIQWLRAQAEARGAASADALELTDLTKEERNPDWLKDKGDLSCLLMLLNVRVSAKTPTFWLQKVKL
uniref:Dynein axonemal assembly factor 4 n=1 Tax=Oryzias latipes TaxID=8090 RepID=A0A3P9H8H8_ORYLA